MGRVDIERAARIDGWMEAAELRWLASAALDCRVIVEAGCYKGRSTRALADHCAGQIYAVDPWDGGYRNDDGSQAAWLDTACARRDFERNLADHLVTGRVIPMAMTLTDARAPLQAAVGGRVDLLFIDGDHRYEQVRDDIETAKALVRRGGMIAGHDYGRVDWPGVRVAVDESFGARVKTLSSIWWVTA